MGTPLTLRTTRNAGTKGAVARSSAPEPKLSYQARITSLAERIRGTEDLSTIIEVLDQALAETRLLRTEHAELRAARRKVAEAERNIAAMRNELEQVKALIQQDPLTATLNRRGIDEAFRQDASRCDRGGAAMCVALIDIDNFKVLNDTHGHQTGDRALTHVAAVVRSNLRPSDRVGRFGGEEFLILLPDTRVQEAAIVLARIKRALGAQPLLEQGQGVYITFSAGVAEREAHEGLEPLLARADTALYQAKRGGKNRISLAA